MTRPQIDNDWSPDVFVFTDASVSENGETRISYVLETIEGEEIAKDSQTLNENKPIHIAEYLAVLRGISVAEENGYTEPAIFTDFEVVVEHVFGESNPEDEMCHTIKDRIISLLKTDFDKWSLEWIPREGNEKAHEAACVTA